ncbi:uncharacterized protein KD926_002642 [Aspergillus affinis]|uniref:uncharacterized protein n=1 Tax=Aspergillus affinis TaxID=1070780 RepID=UPI0022FEBA19|nr:uncharacterized protein KD926_002642 [Aspergillus affinis]KAI9035888.1 hypothetical protein KD926_002642 [Aspergillus affinis]
MPATSRELWERAAIDTIKMVEDGVFQEEAVVEALLHAPARYPNCEGARCIEDNLTDIKAQAATNHHGIKLNICSVKGLNTFEAEDFMDDGSIIKLKITIDEAGGAVFDFGGTSPQTHGNWNAPPAVTNSATIYALRCLVASEIPLNQGCILPVHLKIPKHSLLLPSPDAACAAGNGLTCQRIVDVIFKALEILKRQYPVLLKEYSLRPGSGGKGKFRGGDGVVRELEFQVDMHAGILSERKVFRQYGMTGGEDGARGMNLWIKKNGLTVNIGGKNQWQVKAGDRIRIMTPGGGDMGFRKMKVRPVKEQLVCHLLHLVPTAHIMLCKPSL